MERKERRSFIGVVVSDKSEKTIVVKVEDHKKHAKYGKLVAISKKFAAHDELKLAHMGDTVEIVETRPLSATKRFRLVNIISKAVSTVEVKEVA
jgi:small subunit ribosomal protein S17